MNKRQFLTAAVIGSAALPSLTRAQQQKKSSHGPTLLTVTGAIESGNRGPLDPALDQMMYKQKIKFKKAHGFDFAALEMLPAASIKPTIEYDNKPHVLSGPSLLDVIKVAGAQTGPNTKLLLRAIDGYAVVLPLTDIQKYRFIIATHLDNRPMPLGGLGPLWAIYDADRIPELAAKPINERFGLCPWGLYHIEVQT